MLPWFVLLFIIIIFALIAYQLFGISEDTITKVITSSDHGSVFHNWLLTIIIIIALGSLYSVVSSQTSDISGVNVQQDIISAPQQEGFFTALISPEIIGVVAILLTGLFATFYITSQE
ncbi:hypothetical protein HYT23_04440 [Candidatus Pacearchaeota archaeon]|nr:hypothetical protein [Candidatus Pacearchaeota archaeon]